MKRPANRNNQKRSRIGKINNSGNQNNTSARKSPIVYRSSFFLCFLVLFFLSCSHSFIECASLTSVIHFLVSYNEHTVILAYFHVKKPSHLMIERFLSILFNVVRKSYIIFNRNPCSYSLFNHIFNN